MIGEILTHYRILAQIGAGGMGAVYRAEDLKLQREVALKMLPPELAGNPERFERFQREARSVAALNHPNIVTLFSVEEDAGRHFITMELVKGKPLTQVIPKSGLGVKEFLELAIPLADALAAAHEKGITHRDLKPANVMIDEAGRVKVIDFGLAKATGGPSSLDLSQAPTEQLTVEGRILGTPAYMSPEQVEGKPVDHRTDIFALGILYHEMLTGDRPFKGDSALAVLSSVLKDDPASISTLRPDVPLEISRVIRRCLQKHPHERSQSALDVRNELKELQAEFFTGTLTSISQVRLKAARRSPLAKWQMAAVIVILLGAVWTWRQVQIRRETAVRGGAGKVPDTAQGKPATAPLGVPRITRLTTTDRFEMMPTFSPDGRQIAFVAQVGRFKQIFVRDVGSSFARQLTQGEFDYIQPAWGPDTNTMYYARSLRAGENIVKGDSSGGEYQSQLARVMRLDLATGEAESVVAKAAAPTVAPGGQELFFELEFRIWKSDLRGGRMEQLSHDEDGLTHGPPRVSADGRKVVFRRYNIREQRSDLAVVTTNHVMTVVRTNGFHLHPTWHPDGGSIYFTLPIRMAGANIWRLPMNEDNTAAGEPGPVTMSGTKDSEAAFSPDGRRMVFTIASRHSDIYRVSIDPATGKTNGPPAEPMPFNSNREDSRASWAPSTNQLMVAFNSDRSGEMNLHIWREQDNSVTQVTTGSGGDYQPTWSADLQQLVYFSSPYGHSDIFVVGTNANSTPVRLTTNPEPDYNPFFSPDGKHIVFASVRDGRTDLYIMNADGTQQRRLVKGALITHFHPWFDAESVLNPVRLPEQADDEIDYCRVFIADGRVEPLNMLKPYATKISGHGSLSPDRRHYMELNWPHTHIWVLSVTAPEGAVIYQRAHPSAEIDYPWWSPDGRWATFDFAMPRSSELVMAEWSAKE